MKPKLLREAVGFVSMHELNRRLAWLLVVCGLGTVACSSCEHEPEKTDGTAELMLDQAPRGMKRSNIDYDGKVTLIGYRTPRRNTMRPGQAATVVLYWRAEKKLEPGHRLFARLLDEAGETVAELDQASPLRENKSFGLDTWQPGKIYVDELSFKVPQRLKTARVQLVAGVSHGDDRLKIVSGPSIDATSGLVMTVPTGVRNRKPPAIAALRVDRIDAKTEIKIDGKLDEEVWKDAPSGTFVNVISGERAKGPLSGSFKVLWSPVGMYVAFDVKDEDILGGFKPTEKDPHLWTSDTVEMMIDPDGDGDNKDYYEVQINPQNLVFDTQYDEQNTPAVEPDGPYGHQEWSSGVKSAVIVQGTIDKSDDKDEGYVVEALIPWKSFSKAKKVPPAIGDSWRVDFFLLTKRGSLAWSPMMDSGTFHNGPRFGRILWAQKGWTEPSASPAPSSSSEVPVAAPTPSGSGAALSRVVQRLQAAKPALPGPAAPNMPPAAVPAPAASK